MNLAFTLFEWAVVAYPFILALLIALCLIGLVIALKSNDTDKSITAISTLWMCCFPSTLLAIWFYPDSWLEMLIAGVIAGVIIHFWFEAAKKRLIAKLQAEEAAFYAKHPESKIWGHFNFQSMPEHPYISGLIQCLHVSYRHTKESTYMHSYSRFAGREKEFSKATSSKHFKPSEFRTGNQNIEMHFDNGMTVHIDLPYTVNKSGSCENPVSAGYVEFRDEDFNEIKIPVYIW